MADAIPSEPISQDPLEQAVEDEALNVELRAATLACLSGGESGRWTISELIERFKNLGISASRTSVTAALAELEAVGCAIYADREGMDATTPHGRAMLQMAAVFAELERDPKFAR